MAALAVFSWFSFYRFGSFPLEQLGTIPYPWLYVGIQTRPDNSEREIRLIVKEYSSEADPNSDVASMLPLEDLSLSISAVTSYSQAKEDSFNYFFCPVLPKTERQVWDNRNDSQQPIVRINLQGGFTVLKIEASSRNAQWHGIIAFNKTKDALDWEEFMGGWVTKDGLKARVVASEVHKDGKSVRTFGGPLPSITLEMLRKYGVPETTDPDIDKQRCSALSG